MNKLFLAFIALTFSISAFADIPRPPKPKNFSEMQIIGDEATDLARRIEGSWVRGFPKDGAFCTYKVYRSPSGQTQIACQIWTGETTQSDLCVIKKSVDRHPLPPFNPQNGL